MGNLLSYASIDLTQNNLTGSLPCELAGPNVKADASLARPTPCDKSITTTATPSINSDSSGRKSETSLSAGAIAGIVVGALSLIAALTFVYFYFAKIRDSRKSNQESKSIDSKSNQDKQIGSDSFMIANGR